jgi:hypothetical protein
MKKCKSKTVCGKLADGTVLYRNCKRAGAYQGFCYQHTNGKDKTGAGGFIRTSLKTGNQV